MYRPTQSHHGGARCNASESLLVQRMGFEPTQANAHYPLKVACLPIPPPLRGPLGVTPLLYTIPRKKQMP